MPLSKKRQAEYMRNHRKALYLNKDGVIPKEDAPQSKSSGIEKALDATAPLSVIPKQPWEVTDWKSYKGEVVPIPNCKDGRYRRDNANL